jgi:hypothetical protein
MDVGKIVDVSGKKYISIHDHDASGEWFGCSNCSFFGHQACDSIDDCSTVIFKPYIEKSVVTETPATATEIPKVEMVQNYEDVYYVLQYPNGKFARLDSGSRGYSYEVGFKNAEKFTIEKAEEYLRVSNRERFVIKKVNTKSVLTTINA